MSQNASVIESENVEEESDEEDQEALDQCQTEEVRSRQGERRKSRRKLKTKLKNEFSTISTMMEVKGLEMMRIRKYVNLTVQQKKEVPRQDGVNEKTREHLTSTIVNAKVYSHG